MVFLKLALRNISRNWYRSLLGIIGMALAGAIMTGSISMTTGYPAESFKVYRQFVGGDIIIYPGKFNLERKDVTGQSRWQSWELRGPQEAYKNDLSFFHPLMTEEGFLAPSEQGEESLSLELISRLRKRPKVEAVYPYYVMPAFLEREGKKYRAPLRGRSIAKDEDMLSFSELITLGRYFRPDEAGERVALVNGARPRYYPVYGTRLEYSPPKVGSYIKVLVPHVRTWRKGTPVYDYSQFETYSLKVVGHFELPTHEEVYKDENMRTVRDRFDNPIKGQYYWETPQILVPKDTLLAMMKEVGGGDSEAVHQMSVVLESNFYAKSVAEELASELPEHTVLTVPQQVKRSFEEKGQSGVPADVSYLFTILAFVTAGMLVVANMYVLVIQRRRELGVLKAIGVSTAEMLGLILAETVGISVLGAILGFGFIRLVVSGMLLISEVSLLRAGFLTLKAFGAVMAATTGVAVIFGLLPAWEAASSTTVEVLKHE